MPSWLVKRRLNQIHILGEVKSALHFVRSMDVMIMPFKSGGVRVKVLEALAAGIPCIGTSKAFQGLAVADNQEVLVAEDVEQFVESICRISSEEGLWDGRQRGMHYVDRHQPIEYRQGLFMIEIFNRHERSINDYGCLTFLFGLHVDYISRRYAFCISQSSSQSSRSSS